MARAKKDFFKVSQSKIKTYRTCRQAYFYKYVEKLKRNRKSRPLKFGTIVHSMLEAKANKQDPFKVLKDMGLAEKKLFREEREMYGDIIQDIKFIMTDYCEHWKGDGLITLKKDGVAAEHEFDVEIAKDIVMTGKIDQAFKTKDGLRWLGEHKTFGRSIPHPDHMWRNLQSAIYLKTMSILGWKPMDGVLWNYIHSKPPGKVSINRDGSVSKKRINTLPSALIASLEAADLDPADYATLISSAKQNRKNYFQRIYTPVNHEIVDQVYKEFVDTAIEMSDNHGKSKCRTFGRHCEWCDYEPLCRAELTGADVDYLKERDYHVEVKEEKAVIEEE